MMAKFKPSYLPQGCAAMAAVYMFICMAWGMCSSCRTVDLFKTKTDTKKDSVIVTKYDSASLKQAKESETFLREIVKDYAQREPQPVITPEGKTIYIPQPPTIIRETIREAGTAQKETTEQVQVNRSDSLLYALVQSINTTDKKTTGLGLMGWLAIAAISIVLILILAIIFIIKRQGDKFSSIINTIGK